MARPRGVPKSLRSLLFYLGVRPAYRLEVSFAALALVLFAVSEVLRVATTLPVVASLAALLMIPIILQAAGRYYRARLLPKDRKVSLPPPRVPLFVILASAVVAAGVPLLLPIALFNAMMVEDVVSFVVLADRVKIRHGVSMLIEPFAKARLATTLAIVLVPSILSYIIVRNPVVFIYPAIAYAMIAYSLIFVPSEIQETVKEGGGGFLESISTSVPILYFFFRSFYFRRDMVRQGKEAGLIGNQYYEFVRKGAGAFTISTFVSIALAPALYVFLAPLGLGLVALLMPLAVPPVALVAPSLAIKMRRNSRAGKISRNLLLILTYFSSMASVAERFTNAMEYLRNNKALAKMFGMEQEAEIYTSIYSMTNDESVAMKDYADTVPDDFYRDTIRTMKDLVEAEGYGAAFRSLTARIRDYTARYIDRVTATFQDIGSNIISTLILVETTVPIFMFLSSPMLAPVVTLITGSLSGLMIAMIAMSTMPDLPSEYLNMKRRMRQGAIVFVIASAALTAIEKVFFSGTLLATLAVLNVAAALGLAFDYAVRRDLRLNNELLDKFPDLLILFSSSLIQSNSVERSLRELSQQTTFSDVLREEFRKLSNMFAILNVEQISYRGVYWRKYFTFLARIAASYGTAPRDLYKSISDFMLEFKKFFSSVSAFGASLLFLTAISLAILNMETFIMLGFSHVFATIHISSVGGISFSNPLPTLTSAQLQQLNEESYIALLVVALSNGLGLAKVIDGTFRAGRWVFIMYVVELAMIVVGMTTGFGFANIFAKAATSSATS